MLLRQAEIRFCVYEIDCQVDPGVPALQVVIPAPPKRGRARTPGAAAPTRQDYRFPETFSGDLRIPPHLSSLEPGGRDAQSPIHAADGV